MGGGNFITQSFPTNFHQFWEKKILTKDEKLEDFKEVTEKEKTALEASDAAWERPPQELIDRWNAAWYVDRIVYGEYNENTGYFEGNTLKDITTPEAYTILEQGMWKPGQKIRIGVPCRTNLFPSFSSLSSASTIISMANSLSQTNTIEVFRVAADNEALMCKELSYFMINASKLKKVIGILNVTDTANMWICGKSDVLEDIKIKGLHSNITSFYSRFLTLETFRYIIENRYPSDKIISISVHPDVYSKLTDPDNTEWYALNELAISKNITFATA